VLPNFFIVGAAKSGTSSLASYLSQHPEIGFSTEKEPNYFVFKGRNLRTQPGPAPGPVLFDQLYKYSATTTNDYHRMFEHSADCPARGDASVRYLYAPQAAAEIAEAVPGAKIIIMLRNPVDRLWSHYIMMKARYHLEPASLEEALQLEPERIRSGWDYDWHYVAVGSYCQQIVRYFECFGRENVQIHFYEDFCRQPQVVLEDVYRFLGVTPGFQADLSQREMVGYWLRAFWPDKLLFYPHGKQQLLLRLLSPRGLRMLRRCSISLNRVPPPQLSAAKRGRLRSLFVEDIQRLAKLLGRRLKW
jgi:hypothetical protein